MITQTIVLGQVPKPNATCMSGTMARIGTLWSATRNG